VPEDEELPSAGSESLLLNRDGCEKEEEEEDEEEEEEEDEDDDDDDDEEEEEEEEEEDEHDQEDEEDWTCNYCRCSLYTSDFVPYSKRDDANAGMDVCKASEVQFCH
jgi:hypothetical protein